MARALWKGAINFGLVHIPIRMIRAASSKDIHFRQLHEEDLTPIKLKKVCSLDGEELEADEIVKGYEIRKNEFVVVDDDEIKALQAAESGESNTIDIESFVMLEDVDPVYFENSYYLTPEKGAGKPYALLMDAMEQSGRAALARVIMRTKQHLVLLRPGGKFMAMSTLYYSHEVVDQDEIEASAPSVKLSKREIDMAVQLIESLADDFEPEKYRDEFRDQVLELVESKAAGKTTKIEKPRQQPAKVIDLVSALQASLEGKSKSAPAKSPAKSKAKPAAKKTPRKKSKVA